MNNEELVILYQNGSNEALEELVLRNKGIVNKMVNKFYIEGTVSVDREDLEQEGYIGLVTAAKKYDINNPKKAQFITYAIHWIYQRISKFVNKRATNEEISINKPISEDNEAELLNYIEGVDYSFENIDHKIYCSQLREELEEVMLKSISLRERNVIKFHYGWDNKKLTFQDIGEIYDITSERVRQIENIALRKLRESKWGRVKAMEVYRVKKVGSSCSIEKTLDNINFAQKYFLEVI